MLMAGVVVGIIIIGSAATIAPQLVGDEPRWREIRHAVHRLCEARHVPRNSPPGIRGSADLLREFFVLSGFSGAGVSRQVVTGLLSAAGYGACRVAVAKDHNMFGILFLWATTKGWHRGTL
jgi:hypothetical protein